MRVVNVRFVSPLSALMLVIELSWSLRKMVSR